MTLRSAFSLPAEIPHVSARLLRRSLVLAALTAAMPVWADAPAPAPGTLTVKPGQSLNDLAVEVTQSHDKGVLARVSQALFAANPRAFMKHDPSLLMVGATLQVPADAASGAVAVAASGASSAAAASSPAPGASAVAAQAASTVPGPMPAAVAASATAAASAPAATQPATQPATGAATASEAAGAGTMADNASASTGASAAAPASGSAAAAGAGAAVSAASAALAGAKNELDGATKAWAGLGDDVRTGVLAVLAAVVLLLVGLVWRRRRRARTEGKVEPFVAAQAARPAAATAHSDSARASAPVASAAPVATSPEASGADAAPEVPVRSAAAQALARAMSPDPDEAHAADEKPQGAPVMEPTQSADDESRPVDAAPIGGMTAVSVAAGTEAVPASEPIVPQEMFSYHTTMVGQVMPLTGTHASSADISAQAATPVSSADVDDASPVAQPQPLHTIPPDAIAALDGLGMSLPPRIPTGPIEPATSFGHDTAPASGYPTNETSGMDAQAAHPGAVSGLGSASFGPLDLGFDLEHSASAAGASQAPSPEVLARIARNKLELAHEYVNIGDLAGARVLTQEVIDAGHPDTREAAQALLARLKELS